MKHRKRRDLNDFCCINLEVKLVHFLCFHFLELSKSKNISVTERLLSYTTRSVLDLACNMLSEPGLISSGSFVPQYRISVY